MAPPPTEPIRRNPSEAAARAALDSYVPGFFDKLLGGAKKQRALLEQAVQQGAAADQQQYEAALNEHRMRLNQWDYQVKLAPGVMRLNLDACRSAMKYVAAFDELEEFETRVALDALVQNTATFSCLIQDQEIVPTEEVKLTAAGKLTTRRWPPASTGPCIRIMWRLVRSG
jgi:hypothetical protein